MKNNVLKIFNILLQGLNQSYVPGLIPQENLQKNFPISYKVCSTLKRELKINLLNHALDGSKGHGLHLIYLSNGKTLKLMDLAICDVLKQQNFKQKYWNVLFDLKHVLIALELTINDVEINVSFINSYHLSSNQFERKLNGEYFKDKFGKQFKVIKDDLYDKIKP